MGWLVLIKCNQLMAKSRRKSGWGAYNGWKYRIETLTNWRQIRQFSKHLWLFRGQENAEWNLETSLERVCKHHKINGRKRPLVEREIFREFRRAYNLYAERTPSSVIEWFSLMQHYGAPTRLLDFSYSIYVATYFAAEKAQGDCAVWAIDGKMAIRKAVPLLEEGGKNRGRASQGLEQMKQLKKFEEGDDEKATPLYFEEPFVTVAWPINAFHLNERLRIQTGVFMVPGDIRKPFMRNLQTLMTEESNAHFLKIIIPHEEAKKALRELFSMNISRTSLFPGLDGFAQSLRIWNPAFAAKGW
jgi:hypothetical protein